ncbi:hypothetical protein [Brevifollis gellanilyticus]|uniref:Uncharacterized protein n=1 Tax=Brevifollis gellanilyticus TaxID=748831 RepID=A0A512MHX6_9BACT|nr:hypothetical protein [Brevifollis gellanilyticus]GEP46334.1 hypothetical protein BGE01nite_56250 [Brevifollis gellanilyticus]
MSESSEEQSPPDTALVAPRPRYLRGAAILWVIFAFLKLVDNYDGILSFIGAPFVATFMTLVAMPLALLMGLVLRWPAACSWWYSSRRPAALMLTLTMILIFFAQSLGLGERIIDEVDGGSYFVMYGAVSLPSFLGMVFAIVYWPARSGQQGRKQALE